MELMRKIKIKGKPLPDGFLAVVGVNKFEKMVKQA